MSHDTKNTSTVSAGNNRSTQRASESGAKQQVRERLHQSRVAAGQCVEDHPVTAVATSFISGVILGTCVGLILGSSGPRSPWYSREAAERFGHRVLSSMSDAMPDALKR